LATITALELQLHFSKVKELHTFGAPRVGNPAFASFLKQRLPNTFRIIHYRDLAPHLPF
jgi:predicted lipase